MKKFENLGKSLSKEEQKNVKGAVDGAGLGYSCECKNGKSAGMASCDNCDCWCVEQGSTVNTCD